MFNITNFTSTLSARGGLASAAHYYVIITPPKWYQSTGERVTSDLQFLCSSASLPGIAWATSEIRHYGYGPTEKKPYAPIFTDAELSFLSTADGKIHKFFHDWMVNISYFSLDKTINGGSTGITPYAMRYPEEYQTTIEICTFDRQAKQIVRVKLLDAYPLQLNDIQYGWEAMNSIVQIPVKFTYRSWTSETLPFTRTRNVNAAGNTADDLEARLLASASGNTNSGSPSALVQQIYQSSAQFN
jgi:hypothetical protein